MSLHHESPRNSADVSLLKSYIREMPYYVAITCVHQYGQRLSRGDIDQEEWTMSYGKKMKAVLAGIACSRGRTTLFGQVVCVA